VVAARTPDALITGDDWNVFAREALRATEKIAQVSQYMNLH